MLSEQIKARLLGYFGAEGVAQAILCPSGTDALLTTAMLLAAERPGEAMTAILPSASETGTGVPMAAMCRVFDGPDSGAPVAGCPGTTVEIPLRSVDGSPRGEDEVNDAFIAAAAAVAGRAVVILLRHEDGADRAGVPPQGADVIVDAARHALIPRQSRRFCGGAGRSL